MFKNVKIFTPATVIHSHKVALAFIGIGHLIVKKTQVNLCNAKSKNKRRKRRVSQVRKFKDVDMTEDRVDQNRAERGEKNRFQLPLIIACASCSLSQGLIQWPCNEIRLTDCSLCKVITYAYQMRRHTESVSFRLIIHIC